MTPSQITREKAAALGLKRFFTGAACALGHICERYVNCGKCVECVAQNRRKYRAENADKVCSQRRARDLENRSRETERARGWRERNGEKARASTRRWQQENKDRVAAYQRSRKAERNDSSRRRRRERRATDPLFALEDVVRGRVGRR